ncbi:MAG: zeta toxin family protein [Bacteroidales bacterium]|nr:zeta toxin family protein [Bacteroidales bacterium]MCD8394874.1 zeta toxin family protein [Bacteroidales bacterium]
MHDNCHRPVLIIVAGPNGSGKTSVTHKISRYDKSVGNCVAIAPYVDRLYVYDNSIDNDEARLLFRFNEGKLAKQYYSDLPNGLYQFLNARGKISIYLFQPGGING